METKAKKRILNTIMVLLILIIAASGVLTVGRLRGWFDRTEESVVRIAAVKGIANIERNGIGYNIASEMNLQSGDKIETKKGAQVKLLWQEQKSLVLNGNTETALELGADDEMKLQVEEGELFADAAEDQKKLLVGFDENEAELSGAVFSISVQAGSSTLNLYAGDVSVILADGVQERVEAGETLSVVKGTDGAVSYQITEMQIASLSEFIISQAQDCKHADELCFTQAQLQQILDDRAAEKQAALEASLNTKLVLETEETKETEDGELQTQTEAVQNDAEQPAEAEVHTISEPAVQEANICTITILCDTILDNMDNLDQGKEAYVPANGTILATSSVEFEEGETVFDVLTRVCEYAGIQIEYSWTAIYDSYYIEGINNLYEFDCGNESGWMYKVNGWFPNYGCSSYELENGDNIVWCYTCNGLGADVGGAVY